MADYQLSYSGEEVDAVCKKVKDMSFTAEQINHFFNMKNKLQMRWGRAILKGEIKKGEIKWIYFSINDIFNGNFTEGIESRDDPAIIVSCDYGGLGFDNTCVYYERDERSVKGTVRIESELDGTTEYKITVYCLVIFTENGDEGIE